MSFNMAQTKDPEDNVYTLYGPVKPPRFPSYWDFQTQVTGAGSYYGLQVAQAGDNDPVGVLTLPDKSLMSFKFNGTKWASPTKMPALYKAQGRVSMAEVDSRIYLAYRGTNDGVYLLYAESGSDEWVDLGRVGSKYAKTTVAPAISQQLIFDKNQDFVGIGVMVTGVGEDKYIYYTTVTVEDGKRTISWTKIPGTGTRSALSLTRNLTLVHTGYNNGAFFFQYFDDETNMWSDLKKVEAEGISSGPAAVAYGSSFFVAYKGTDGLPRGKLVEYDGTSKNEVTIAGVPMLYQLGALGTYGSDIVMSVPFDFSDVDAASRKQLEGFAGQTMTYVSLRDVEMNEKEWHCKWQEQGESKGSIKKYFCW